MQQQREEGKRECVANCNWCQEMLVSLGAWLGSAVKFGREVPVGLSWQIHHKFINLGAREGAGHGNQYHLEHVEMS